MIQTADLRLWVDSIAASLFVLNWLSWQIVSDDKIQITILILRRGALSRLGAGWVAMILVIMMMVMVW